MVKTGLSVIPIYFSSSLLLTFIKLEFLLGLLLSYKGQDHLNYYKERESDIHSCSKIFVSLDLLTKVLTTMEVPKVKKLCNELNQMGVKHLIFTLDNVSLKTFGDSDSIKILGEGSVLREWVLEVREVKSEMKIWFTHFENEKWNQNALRSRSRMESEMKIP